jgi:MFS family permease
LVRSGRNIYGTALEKPGPSLVRRNRKEVNKFPEERAVRRIPYGWWVVGSCFVLNVLVSGIVSYGLTALFLPLRRDFAWSYTQISFAFSLRGVEIGIFSPFSGAIVDSFGARRLMVVGIFVVSLGLIVLSFTQSLPWFYAAVVLLAIGASASTGVVTLAAVARWFDRDLGKALGITLAGAGAGGLLVPMVTWLIDSLGWRPAMMVLSACTMAIGVPAGLTVRSPGPGSASAAELSERAVLSGGIGADCGGPDQEFRNAVKSLPYFCINVGEMVRFGAVAAVITHIMPYLSSLGVPRGVTALAAGGVPILSTTGRLVFGWVSDLMDGRRAMTLTLVAMMLGILAFCWAGNTLFLLVFFLLFPMGYGGGIVSRATMVRDYFGRRCFGKLLGINLAFGALGAVITPAAAGLVFDEFGVYWPVWGALSVLLAAAAWLNEAMPGIPVPDRGYNTRVVSL